MAEKTSVADLLAESASRSVILVPSDIAERGSEGLYTLNSTDHSGAIANGTIALTANPAVGDTINVNGHVFVFAAPGSGSPPSGQVAIADTSSGTATNLAARLTAVGEDDATTVQFTASATTNPNVIRLEAVTPGVAGNLIGISINSAVQFVTATAGTAPTPTVKAKREMTLLGNPVSGQYVEIRTGGTPAQRTSDEAAYFYFTDEITLNPRLVPIGSNSTFTAQNLRWRIRAANLDPGVTAVLARRETDEDPYKIELSAAIAGTAGNSIALAASGTIITVSGASLSGGNAAAQASGHILFAAPANANSPTIADGNSVTIGGVVFTFKTEPNPLKFIEEVPIVVVAAKTILDDTLVNLVARIRAAAHPSAAVVASVSASGGARSVFEAHVPDRALTIASSPALHFSGPLLTGGTLAAATDQGVATRSNDPFGNALKFLLPPSAAPVGAPSEAATDPAGLAAGKYGVWVPRIERIRPWRFGDYNRANNHLLVQAALRAGALHNMVVEIDRPIEVETPVNLPSGCIVEGVDGDAALIAFGATADAFGSAMRAGSWHGQYLSNSDFAQYIKFIDWFDCKPTDGGAVLRLQEPWHARMFPIGSTILVRDRRFYKAVQSETRTLQVPFQFLANVRVERPGATDPGLLHLAFPIPYGMDVPQVAMGQDPLAFHQDDNSVKRYLEGQVLPDYYTQQSNDRRRTVNGNMGVCRDARWYGVSLISQGRLAEGGKDEVPPASAVGKDSTILNCDFDIPRIWSRTGVYFNGINYSKIRVGNVRATEKVLEFANGGACFEVHIGSATAYQGADTNVGAPVQIGECPVDAKAVIGELTVEGDYVVKTGEEPEQFVVVVRAARGIDLTINRLHAPRWSSSSNAALVGFVNSDRLGIDEAGEPEAEGVPEGFQNETSDINVTIGHAEGGPMLTRYCVFKNSGGKLSNVELRANFHGQLAGGATVDGVVLAGKNIRFHGYVEDGGIDYAGANGYTIRATGQQITAGDLFEAVT